MTEERKRLSGSFKGHCVAYAAKDLEKAAEFYLKVMGCVFIPRPKHLEYDGFIMANIPSGFKAEIINAKKQELAVGMYCLNYDHQAFYVKSIEKSCEILQQHGLEYMLTSCHKQGMERGRSCCIVLKDPENNTIVLLPEPDDQQKQRYDELIAQTQSVLDNLKKMRGQNEVQKIPQDLETLEEKIIKEQKFLPITRLAFIARVAADVEESAKFYSDFLGFERLPLPDCTHLDGLLVGHPDTGLMIWLVPGYHVMQPEVEVVGKNAPPLDLTGQLGILAQDLDGWKKYLKSKNVQFNEWTKPGYNIHCVHFKDPVGHVIEILSYEDEQKASTFIPPKEFSQRLCEIAKTQKDIFKGHKEMQVGV